jgi:DNA (cytosine-5)-methyltransferase 1
MLCPVCGHPGPLLADWCSGAGGAGRGYQLAGFHITGYDIRPQPRYPGCFIQADVMDAPLDGFDAFHASPPCQDHSHSLRNLPRHGTGWLLAATRQRLEATGRPWVIENVSFAPMRPDYILCGSMFGLPHLIRHRWFETSWHGYTLRAPCWHHDGTISVYGGGYSVDGFGRRPTRAEYQTAMGIDWMTIRQMGQAVPPAYTQLIGADLLAQLGGRGGTRDPRTARLGSPVRGRASAIRHASYPEIRPGSV